jgi:MFS family permease
MRRALRNPVFLGGLGLMALASLLFGVLATLAPLRLSAAGWGAVAIGAVWLISASFETVLSPVAGRVLDRRGFILPVQLALTGGVAVSIGLAFSPRPLVYVPLVILAGGSFGVLFTPSFALIAEGAERVGLPQGMAFGLMNAAWASGALVGPAVGGAVADAFGDVVPFVIAAGLCGAALLAALRQRTAGRVAESDVAG